MMSLTSEHFNPKLFECDQCGSCFKTKHLLASHRRVHTNDKPFKCDICEKSFTNKAHLTAHCAVHSEARPFECKQCDKRFKTVAHLAKHQKLHLPEHLQVRHQCQLCDRSFSTAASLRYHQANHSDERPFRCDKCGVCFKQEQNLHHHSKVHHPECHPFKHAISRPCYICEHCQTLWPTRARLAIHLASHKSAANRPFECDVCQKQFNQAVHLRTHHQSVHSNDRPYKCRTCDQKFRSTDRRGKHEALHQETRWRFECDFCGVIFSKMDHLNNHRRIHTNDKPYSCDICKKKFRDVNQMTLHQRTKCSANPFKCEHEGCKYTSCYIANLRRHVREMHEKPCARKSYICQYCEQILISYDDYYTHRQTDCGMNPYKCGFDDCSYTARHRASLIAHVTSIHSKTS